MPTFAVHRQTLPVAFALLAVAEGLVILLGWYSPLSGLLAGPLAAVETMAPSSGLALTFLGISLLCEIAGKNFFSRLTAALVLILGGHTLVHAFLPNAFSLDIYYFSHLPNPQHGLHPLVMAPNSAVCFILLAGGIA